jgi:hypothetical protein
MPPAAPDLRSRIQEALAAFASQAFDSAAVGFFNILGYGSPRHFRYDSATAFFSQFDPSGNVAALFPSGGPSVLLQQLTGEEISRNSTAQMVLSPAQKVPRTDPELRNFDSYLFLAISLSDEKHSRTHLGDLTRALNSLFRQPVLVLFRHGASISLAITYRRANQKDATRDVIARKVTLIHEIDFAHPHPGHVAILEDFSLPAIARVRQRDIRTFADLDDAWRDSISTDLLTKRFYREIANWYFWAREHATFPKDAPVDADGKPSLPLIRLLTRLLFCWFLREKNDPKTGRRLLPDDLFDEPRIRELLHDTSPKASTYYLAILQNLFFATLNTPREDEHGRPLRKFIEEAEEEADDPSEVHGIQHFWRHQKTLRDIPRFETLFRAIPFLNGGLFECLDETLTGKSGRKIGERRIDGFSVKPAKQPRLPNFLFFGPEQKDVNLSGAYGDSSRQHETVRPLLEIFRHYKFTLTENTPIDEVVALDPDLLGHVFENLLAAYNPETGTIARKATGSFYTPDIVVDWMVDQALLVYLEERLLATHPSAANVTGRLRDLLSWELTTHAFTPKEVDIRIESSENKSHPWSEATTPKEAENIFAKTLPAIHAFFTEPIRRKALVDRYDQGRYFWELRSCDYWDAFTEPKMIVPAITGTVNYAPDEKGYYCNNKATIFIPPSVPYALAVANSQVSWWFARQRFATKQGGFYDFEPRYSATTPIPTATSEQTQLVERLSEVIIWLHSPQAIATTEPPISSTACSRRCSTDYPCSTAEVAAGSEICTARRFVRAPAIGPSALSAASPTPAKRLARPCKIISLMS